MKTSNLSHGAGRVTPESDEAPTVASGQGFQEFKQDESVEFNAAGIAEQAAFAIEGEEYARAYLYRLRSDSTQPGDLATLMGFLCGAMLEGACRVIEKALGGVR